MNLNKKIIGGDGYTINVNESIGGTPGFIRYSNNYKPIYDGELLQNGGNEDKDVYTLIKLKGGQDINSNTNKQFEAIKILSNLLNPLSYDDILKTNTNIYLEILSKEDPLKAQKFMKYKDNLNNELVNLGKNNLVVLSSVLLLHYYATNKKNNSHILKGGNTFISSLSDILSPIGVNSNGSSIILVLLQQAFNTTKNNSPIQKGGNPLKNIIAPLGTNAFIASGLLITLKKLFSNTINNTKKNNNKMIGGKTNKIYEKLFNILAPLSFNSFAKESFLKNYLKNYVKNK